MAFFLDAGQSFGESISQIAVFVQFVDYEFDGQPGFGLNAFRRQEIHIAYLVGVFAKVADLNQAPFQETFEDVIDLAKANASVISQLSLGEDLLRVECV